MYLRDEYLFLPQLLEKQRQKIHYPLLFLLNNLSYVPKHKLFIIYSSVCNSQVLLTSKVTLLSSSPARFVIAGVHTSSFESSSPLSLLTEDNLSTSSFGGNSLARLPSILLFALSDLFQFF